MSLVLEAKLSLLIQEVGVFSVLLTLKTSLLDLDFLVKQTLLLLLKVQAFSDLLLDVHSTTNQATTLVVVPHSVKTENF